MSNSVTISPDVAAVKIKHDKSVVNISHDVSAVNIAHEEKTVEINHGQKEVAVIEVSEQGPMGPAGKDGYFLYDTYPTITARNDFFTANPAELKDQMVVAIDDSLTVTYQQYNQSTGLWPDVTAIFTGKDGVDGADGTTIPGGVALDPPGINDVLKFNGTDYVPVPEGTDFSFSIASFSDGQSSPQLIGSGVWKTIGALSFVASYVNGPPTTASISSSSWVANLDIISGSVASAEETNYPASPNSSITFTLTTDPAGTASQSVAFINTTLFGISGSLSENGANEDNTYTKTISAGAGQFVEFSYPDRLTDIAQVRVGGITASFNPDRTLIAPAISAPAIYTNSAWYSESFVSVVSTLDNLGAFSSTVETRSDSTPINYEFYGVTTKASGYLEVDIESLASKTISNDNTQAWPAITAGATEYLVFAFPVRLGLVSFWVGGFEGGFLAPETVTVTNPAGFQEDYYVWRSTNTNLGSTVVETK